MFRCSYLVFAPATNSPAFRRLRYQRHSFRRLLARTLQGTDPYWTRSAGRFCHMHRRQQWLTFFGSLPWFLLSVVSDDSGKIGEIREFRLDDDFAIGASANEFIRYWRHKFFNKTEKEQRLKYSMEDERFFFSSLFPIHFRTQFDFPTLTSDLNLFSYDYWTKLKGFTIFKDTKNSVKLSKFFSVARKTLKLFCVRLFVATLRPFQRPRFFQRERIYGMIYFWWFPSIVERMTIAKC